MHVKVHPTTDIRVQPDCCCTMYIHVCWHPQERHMQLLADYGRQVRVADIARTVQGEAATALTASQRSAIQVNYLSVPPL